MADKKISALTAATTPLAGTEVLPIVQSGATVKVSVANLTAGRSVSASQITTTNNAGIGVSPAAWYTSFNTKALQVAASGSLAGLDVNDSDRRVYVTNNGFINSSGNFAYLNNGAATQYEQSAGSHIWYNAVSGTAGGAISFTQALTLDASSNLKANVGNLVIGTAGKGIDFSANANAPGMTSEVLTWYEEGTWTPNQGAGLVVTGSFSSTGTYTRIGRQVTVRGTLSGSTNIAANAVGVMCSNLPFASAADTPGNYFNGSVTSGGQIDAAASSIYAVGAIAATNTIYFSVTYFV